MRTCSLCGEKKPLLEYYERSPGKLRAECKRCVRGRNKNYYEKTYSNSEHRKVNKPSLGRRKHYPALFEAQGGRCAICGTHESKVGRKLHVDHDHETEVIRELLCGSCNMGLGNFKDDPERLAKAIEYLSKHRAVV